MLSNLLAMQHTVLLKVRNPVLRLICPARHSVTARMKSGIVLRRRKLLLIVANRQCREADMDWIKQRYHFILAGVWVILVAPSMIWWAESILWVIFLSLYANFESSMAAGESRKDRE